MGSATKYALEAALTELLNTTTLDKITIRDIVDRAQVSRQTFYYHFGDVYELVDWSFQATIRRLSEMPAKDGQERILIAVELLREKQNLVMNVYHSLGLERLMAGLEKAIRPMVVETLAEREAQVPGSPAGQEFRISFLVHGIIGSIVQWLDEGMPENIYEIINDLYEQFQPGHGLLIDNAKAEGAAADHKNR